MVDKVAIMFGLQKLTPIRGRKPIASASETTAFKSLHKLTPIRGRKQFTSLTLCGLQSKFTEANPDKGTETPA